jgi:hypothetical protein
MRSPCCLYVYPTTVARQRLGKHVSAVMNTRTDRRNVGRVVFYAVSAVSKESLCVYLRIPLLFLGNGSVITFLRQRIFIEGVFSMRYVSYQRKVGVLLFPELLVLSLQVTALKLTTSTHTLDWHWTWRPSSWYKCNVCTWPSVFKQSRKHAVCKVKWASFQ